MGSGEAEQGLPTFLFNSLNRRDPKSASCSVTLQEPLDPSAAAQGPSSGFSPVFVLLWAVLGGVRTFSSQDFWGGV